MHAARYHIDIGRHVFPTAKYHLVRDRLLETGVLAPGDLVEPQPAAWEDLARVHAREYLHALRTGAMTPDEIARLELPWSEEMVEGFRLMVGGTIEAALLACGPEASGTRSRESGSGWGPGSGIACHLGGGLHHAYPGHGEGFCPFNDVAVAARVLQSRGLARIGIIDLDVHHGNGTAFIFESDPEVFTFSMHQQHNYPMFKPRGSLDIGLADGTHDATYLARLDAALPAVVAHRPRCVFYLAGADPYEDDQLGGLRLTMAGLRTRDRMVMRSIRLAGIPLVVVLAGGYARHVDDTIAIHAATVEEAVEVQSAG
ncbi:MAG: histone deacetylase [Acidobacteria bacterium]|nr:histone deacetylase [Acidobacteriota bacterium]